MWKDECGVFGIWNDPEASRITYLGLYALQHRGQEAAGIVSLKGRGGQGKQSHHRGMGLVHDIFTEEVLDSLSGDVAIGHVRYAPRGGNTAINTQPLTARLRRGQVAIAHNGNIVNAHALREKLIQEGAIFQGTNDTEVLLHLLARRGHKKFMEALQESIELLEGAFSLVFLTQKKLIAVRDPQGFRPLVLGKKKNLDGTYSKLLASETCVFDLIGAEYEREIRPGELYWVDDEGEHSVFLKNSKKLSKCIFEHVYFSRPDSVVFGQSVYQSRKEFGRILARESPTEADIVVPVPDSGVAAALGYSEVSQIPFELGIIRNHYVGRTFIEPKQEIRSFGVKVKLNPQSEVLKGKRVIVIDDSVVRGTTSKKIIQLVRQAGALEVHMKIAAPPTISPCFYGVDTPSKKDLIANNMSIEEIREFIGADSLVYLSEEGLYKGTQGNKEDFCAACFNGQYPTPLFGLDQ